MKIVIDKYIPYLAETLAPYAEVVSLDPDAITADTVHDADALIVRTRTQCNQALLAGSKVQFIATATIGFDHIDAAYCAANHIAWMSCPGCNAQGVCDYVETAINQLPLQGVGGKILQKNKKLTIGIIGCGHVGSKVLQMAQRRGWTTLVSDPPREAKGDIQGVSLQQIAHEADIITFHTPLTHDGNHPTYHLWTKEQFTHMKPNALIINAARGGVVHEGDLLDYLTTHPAAQAAIDCWENEPQLNTHLLRRSNLATYHIAGYTLEGKYNASVMCLQGLIQHFTIDDATAQKLLHHLQQSRIFPTLPQVGFDIHHTSQQLKAHPDQFEALRKAYPLR